jgi:hypothetical protein
MDPQQETADDTSPKDGSGTDQEHVSSASPAADTSNKKEKTLSLKEIEYGVMSFHAIVKPGMFRRSSS